MLPLTLAVARRLSKRLVTNSKNSEAFTLQTRNFVTSNSSMVAFLHEAAFVNNELVQAASGEKFSVVNPVNSEVIGSVPNFSVDDTEKVYFSRGEC